VTKEKEMLSEKGTVKSHSNKKKKGKKKQSKRAPPRGWETRPGISFLQRINGGGGERSSLGMAKRDLRRLQIGSQGSKEGIHRTRVRGKKMGGGTSS